ncbi:MAG: cell division protein FtsL [Wenzhouxiangella sp.]|nr:MAG: cell division protein FtsL [Wenzhouxiangella sp.]
MIRWLLFAILLASLLATSIGVVVLRHESRQLFVALQIAAADRDVANVEWSRLQLEQAWLAEAGRVEREARERLNMHRPDRVGILVEQR